MTLVNRLGAEHVVLLSIFGGEAVRVGCCSIGWHRLAGASQSSALAN